MGLLPGLDSPIPLTEPDGQVSLHPLSAKCLVSSMGCPVAAAAEGDQVVDGGGCHGAKVVHLEVFAGAAALAAKAVAHFAPEF